MGNVLRHLPNPNDYPVGRSAAIEQRVKFYWPEKPCRRNHHSLRRTIGGNCLLCSGDVPAVPGPAQRIREPTPSAVSVDRDLRIAAKSEGEKQFQSIRDCEHGHAMPMRYVSNGGCVLCAARSSRLQYAKRKV